MTHSVEDAVAPVMGHLLMVAVAVIGSVAFGLAADVTRTVAIAVPAEQAGDDVTLTCTGGRDVPSPDRLDVAV